MEGNFLEDFISTLFLGKNLSKIYLHEPIIKTILKLFQLQLGWVTSPLEISIIFSLNHLFLLADWFSDVWYKFQIKEQQEKNK